MVSIFASLPPALCKQAMLRFRVLQEQRPYFDQQRRMQRAKGIVSSLKRGLAGNSKWGWTMLATRASRAATRARQRRIQACSTSSGDGSQDS